MIRLLIHLLVTSKLSIIIEIFSKNYAFLFLDKLKESINEFNEEMISLNYNMIGNILTNKKGLSVNFSKNTSVKSTGTPTSKYKVYESSHSNKISKASYNAKLRNRLEKGKNSNNSGKSVINNNNFELNSKQISSFEVNDIEIADEIIIVWDTTHYISIYNFISKAFTKERVLDIPYDIFLENNRFINLPQKVYVSGGVKEYVCSNLFFVLERKDNKIKILSEMPIPLIRHSLISLNQNIYIIGGKNNLNCYVYNKSENKWHKLNTLNFEREDASLFSFNNMLICFGGLINHKESYLDLLIESTFLDEKKGLLWNVMDVNINVSNNYLIDLQRLSGSGVLFCEVVKNKFYICGGYNNENSDEVNFVFELNFNNINSIDINCNLIKRAEKHLTSPNWFQESNFISYQNKFYNFDIDGNVHIFSSNAEEFSLLENRF